MEFEDFTLSKFARHIHGFPRFGHSNQLALLASDTPNEYVSGIVTFGVFVVFWFVIWTCLLWFLKLNCQGACGSGGHLIDVKALKQQKIPRRQRKRIIQRNWRVQCWALVAISLLLPLSIVILRLGLTPFVEALNDVQHINDLIDSHAYRGIEIIGQMQKSQGNIHALENAGLLNHTNLCPNLQSSDFMDAELDFYEILTQNLGTVDTFIATHQLASHPDTLYQITNVTSNVDDAIDLFLSNDWKLKLVVVVTDVVLIFLCFQILLSKQSIDWPAFQSLTQWLLVPVFCFVLVAVLLGMMILGGLAMLNADFCAGTSAFPSPFGTLHQMITLNGYTQGSLPYDALNYYQTDCLTEPPLQFLEDVQFTVSETNVIVSTLYQAFHDEQLSWNETCGEALHTTNHTLFLLQESLSDMTGTLSAAIELTGCSNINPIFNRVYFGATCNESVKSLAIMFWCLLSISLCGFWLLSVRAAFYNPVIRGRRHKAREKEFDDYKEFMSSFYDTTRWELDWIPEVEDLKIKAADTQSVSTESPPRKGLDDSDMAAISPYGDGDEDYHGDQDSNTDDSSYDSTYSTDDDSSEGPSVFTALSQMFQKKQYLDDSLVGGDEIASTPGTPSIVGRFMVRRTPTTKLLRRDLVSRFLGGKDDQVFNDADSVETDEIIMLTPPPGPGRRATERGRNSRDPEVFEMIPLTPQEASFSQSFYYR